MAKLVVNSFEEFAAHKGERIGESDWVTISQEMIDKFADATLDHQWIHTDRNGARRRALITRPLRMDISSCPFCLICGSNLYR